LAVKKKEVSPMSLTWQNKSVVGARVPKTHALLTRLAGIILLCCSAGCLAFGEDSVGIYSVAAVDSSGKVSGWAVTWVVGMQHEGYVTTALQSPNGRVASASGTWIGQGHSRADVYLPYASNDLGTYTISSYHSAYCAIMGWFILNRLTQSSTTVPFVTLTLRTGNDITVSLDNDKRQGYHDEMNTYILGYFRSGGSSDHIWVTGVEVLGTVKPNTYTGTFTFHRTIVAKRVYHDTVELTQYRADNLPDGVEPLLEDLNPQSNGSNGKIYDLDMPGFGSAASDPPGYIYRKRVNFDEWVTLPDGITKVSNNLLWYSHTSIVASANGDQAEQTYQAQGDNQAGTGNPKTTANLQ
jgi:hypothetical protein